MQQGIGGRKAAILTYLEDVAGREVYRPINQSQKQTKRFPYKKWIPTVIGLKSAFLIVAGVWWNSQSIDHQRAVIITALIDRVAMMRGAPREEVSARLQARFNVASPSRLTRWQYPEAVDSLVRELEG